MVYLYVFEGAESEYVDDSVRGVTVSKANSVRGSTVIGQGKIDRQAFEYTIKQLNNYFAEAERASCSTYCESCLACLTGYLIYICTETHYEKCLRKVAKFVSEQNDRVYRPRGLLLTDPTTRGLRLIEISILDRPAS
ncbi:golgin subfamily A member 7 [Belonocnema kinseyi]|uniref:golgin subfamily A member 7 n=1 Tax=Belonocnema kinseyi TaxID=2817044 RepID=UPI00143CEEC6|nr:golgin subfamily A member 7 [Belonocnema kinseyi]